MCNISLSCFWVEYRLSDIIARVIPKRYASIVLTTLYHLRDMFILWKHIV